MAAPQGLAEPDGRRTDSRSDRPGRPALLRAGLIEAMDVAEVVGPSASPGKAPGSDNGTLWDPRPSSAASAAAWASRTWGGRGADGCGDDPGDHCPPRVQAQQVQAVGRAELWIAIGACAYCRLRLPA